jgi:hypothetical protein
MEGIEERSSRGTFLRRLVKTAAIGMGISLIPVSNAWAGTTCCKSNCGSCAPGDIPYYCSESSTCGGTGHCCICSRDVGQCVTVGCTCV